MSIYIYIFDSKSHCCLLTPRDNNDIGQHVFVQKPSDIEISCTLINDWHCRCRHVIVESIIADILINMLTSILVHQTTFILSSLRPYHYN